MRKKFLLMIFVLSLFTSMGGGWLHAQTKNGVSSTSAKTITLFEDGFEDVFTSLDEEFWTQIDDDGDGKKWYLGNGHIISKSYYEGFGAFDPEDYIVTTSSYTLSESSELTLKIGPNSISYNDNAYKVVISEDMTNWIPVHEENFRNPNNYTSTQTRSISLSEHSGKTVHVGVLHFYGDYHAGSGVIIDNIKLTGAAPAAPEASFEGEGTEASPYLIKSLENLATLRDEVNGGEAFAGKYFKLTSNITLSGEWTAIGKGSRSSKSYTGNAFKGVFDGDNKTISGLTITSTTGNDAAIGLFGVVDGGTVKNLNLTDVNINVTNSNLAGAAIGMMLNGATAEAITVSGAVVGNDGVGGIVGRLIIDGTIKDCTNNASVTSSYGGIGGIVGKAYYEDGANTATFATVTGCTNKGTVTAPMYVGGIAGLARANVTNCVNEGAVVGGTQTGGIVGQLMAAGTVSGNENKAKVSGKSHVGGIIGDYSQSGSYTYNNVTIANNVNRGELAATEQCAAILGCNNIDGFTAMTATGNSSYYFVEGLQLFGNPEDMVIDATNKFIVPVAQVGTETYYTLAEAVAAAQSGDEIKLLANIEGDITVPANVTLNGNGFAISGGILAEGDITFAGVTKAADFDAKYVNTVVNIPAGASLQLTGSARLVIGHGATFNIEGNITDAKTADKATLVPSLKIAAGASITGNGVTFNVNNAYIVSNANTTSKNSNANGVLDFNINNSIWEQTGVLAFYVPTSGKDPVVNFELKNSVLTTTSHLVFSVTKGEIVIDNSLVNQGTSRQIENRSTMTIKNGSVVNGAVATSSNAINPGTIIVDNATYAVTGEFSGAAEGTGTIIIKKGANVSVGSIKAGANVTVDAEGMAAGDEINFTANLSQFTGTLSVINNDKLEAQIVNGKIVLAAKPVAKIGDTPYTTLDAAFAAATEGQTITLLADATPALTSQRAITKAAVIDLGGKTLNLTEDDLYFGTTTFKNGTIVVAPSVKPSTAVFWMFANQTLTFDNVKVVATGVTGTYLIGLDGNNSDLNLLNGSEILVENTTALDLDIICVNASTGNDIKVENSKVNVTNLDGRVFFRGNYTVKDSEVNLAGITKAGFRIEAGQKLSIEGTSKINIEGEPRDGGIHLTDLSATYTKAETATVNATVNEPKVAKVGENTYRTLAQAVAAVEDGGTITLIANETFTKNNRYDNGGWWDGLGYSGDKSFTIDLGGFTVSQDGSLNDYLFWFKNAGSKENTITIKNGTLDAGTTAFCALCTASSHDNKLTVNTENVNLINNISNGSTVKIRAGSVYNAKTGTKITGKNSYLGIENWNATVNIYDGTEIYMNGTSSYNGCLVGVGGNGTVNVYGGYGKGVKGGFIAMTSGGTINVAGGEWIANTDGTVGNNSNLYVLTAQSNKYESGFAGPSIINVTGGTLRGGMDAWVLNNIEGEKAELNITGGNFNANPASYVEAGYVATEAAGIYTVVEAPAYIDGKASYVSLAAAYEAAVNGDVIVLNESVTTFPVINKAVTFKGGKENAAVEINYALSQNFTAIDGIVRFENLTFNKPLFTEHGGNKPGLSIEFEGCNFNVNSEAGYGILIGTSWSNSVVKGLKVNNCNFKYVGTEFKGGYMLYVQCVNEVTITNNTIDGNNLYRGAIHLGDATEHATVATVSNNTIKNFCRGVMMGNRVAGSFATISGNIFDNINYSDKDSKPAHECAPIFIHSNATAAALQVALTDNKVENCANPMIYSEDTDLIKYYVTEFTGNTVGGSAVEFANSYNAPNQIFPVATINDAEYFTLQAAINAVQNGETIVLTKDCAEVVSINKSNVAFTINGKISDTENIAYTGKIQINVGQNVTVKNINFSHAGNEAHDFIANVGSPTGKNYNTTLLVEGCSFVGGNNNYNTVAVRTIHPTHTQIKNSTGTRLHSFLQNTGGQQVTVEGVVLTDSKGGLAIGSPNGAVSVKGCDLTTKTYGVRLDANNTNAPGATLENNKVNAYIPVSVRKATAPNYNLTFNGEENAYDATNGDNVWCAVCTTEYEEGVALNAPTGKVRVALNDTGLSMDGVYGAYVPVAKIGETEYTSLEEAFKVATSGCTIDILSDVTVDYNWDARYTGGKFSVPVTINGNGKTIKFTASVNDNNYQAPFRFEADATVKGLTIDMSETTDSRFRAISSKGNLTVDNCKFIGKDESLNCRAIIFGEGARENVGNLAIAITNSEFKNWKRGITDNENGQDVKTATITGNTLENAAVYVSAYENVTFTGNTVEGAYVNIKSYTAGNKLAVTATDNTLEANTDAAYNVIDAGGVVNAQDRFVVIPKGGNLIAYTGADGIWGEVWGNARESFVIKVLDAEGNVMGSTSLNNIGGIINGNVNVTWNLKFNAVANTDEYWTMAWTTAPTVDNMPAKAQLWVDGKMVSEGNVVLNGPDDINKINVVTTNANGNIVTCHTSFVDAVAAGNNVAILKAGTYALKVKDGLTITGAVDGVEFANIGAFGCNGANVTFNNVTFTYANNSTYKGLQHSGNLVYNNCTFNGQVFLYGASETFNNCTFNTTDSNNYNVWTYGAKEVAFNECTFNCAGKSVLIYNESASVNNNVAVTKSQFNASQAVEGKAAIEMDSSLQGTINLTIEETTATGFAAGNVSGNSLWNNKKANNDITVVVDNETVLAPINGDGTEDNPYLINNVRELVAFRESVNAGKTEFNAPGVYVALNADIDMTGINWVGIGSATAEHGFMGNFDGKNFKIKNLTITNPALDSDGYAYAGLFAVTEGTDKDNQNTIKNLTIENVTINTTGHIAAAAIAYPYYTIVDNVKVCGDIAIKGGDYTAGALAYTRRCVNASNIAVVGEAGSYITGAQVVGGVISDIQMNGGLTAVYSDFSAEGITVTGTKNVGGISGIIATQTLNGATVKNVALSSSDNASVGIVSGALGGTSTISSVTYENVTGATTILGITYNGNAIEARIGDTYYATLKNALAAQGEATVELLAPVTIANGETVVFNLNKKTVVATDNSTGSYAMITNKGDLTIEGEGALKLTATNNRGWNAYSSVISNTVGGKLTVNGGTIEHLGGTDMAYGIDNLTNGKGTYAETVVNGGTVKSTYRAIRQFLNGVEAQNILTVNGGTIEGANKSIWMQDPSKNANTGSLTVGENATLNGNVYLFVTAGSTEWPVEVSIASAALRDGSEVMTGNVPSGYEVALVGGNYGVFKGVAKIGTSYYASLQAAVEAATNGDVITLLKEGLADNVTVSQTPDVKFTIDGAGLTFKGTITVDGKSKAYATAGVTIQNVKFDATAITKDACINLGVSGDNDTRYTSNVTVDNCTFTGTDKAKVGVKNYTGGCKNVTIKNCTATGLHSLAQLKTSTTVTLAENTVTESKNGVSLGSSTGVTVTECTFTVDGYGIRPDGGASVTITDSNISAFIPVVVRNASADASLTFNGTNDMTETNTDGYWCVIGTSEYETNGQLPTDATGKVVVNINDNDLKYEGVYGNYAVAKIGEVQYASLQAAIEDAQNGETVILFADTDEVVSVNVLNKKISIVGEEALFPVLKGGLDFGIDNHSQDAGNITIKGIKFVGNGIRIDDMASVTIAGNIFENITASNAIYVAADEYTTTLAITNNIITNVAGAGINLRNPINATVTGNTITNVTGNAMTFQNDGAIEDVAGEIVITGNVLTDWAYGKTEGRAIRLALGNIADNVIIEENAMIAANAPEEFVKISGTSNAEISVDENYWNGVAPTAAHFLAEGVKIHNYYASYDAQTNTLSNLVTIAGETLEIFYTAAGVETTKEQAAYSLSFAVTDYDNKEASVKIGSKKPTTKDRIEIVTPATVAFEGVEYNVTSLANKAFDGVRGIKELIISEGVKSFGSRALANMYELVNVVFPSTLESVGDQCFTGYGDNHKIKTITCLAATPPTASGYWETASFQMWVAENVILFVAGDAKVYKKAAGWSRFTNILGINSEIEIPGNYYLYTMKVNVTSVSPRAASIKIGRRFPEGVPAILDTIPETASFYGIEFPITSIPEKGFQGVKFEKIVIPGNIKNIGNTAFGGSNLADTLIIEEGVETLGNFAFQGCYSLSEIILPSTLQSVGEKCFNNVGVASTNYDAVEVSLVYTGVTPPTAGANLFSNNIQGTLYVPTLEVVESFKAAAGWNISSIKPFEAKIGETVYYSLAKAIKASKAGDVITLIADVETAKANPIIIPEGVTLDINTHDITANIYGTVKTAGGLWTTVAVPGFNSRDMLGEGAIYNTTDATVVNLANEVNVLAGTIVLNPHPETEWWTLPGQSLSIATGATFEIPAGVKFTVREGNANVNGTLINNGTLAINAGATVTGNLTGDIHFLGGNFITADGYKMVGTTPEYFYNATNALVNIESTFGDITILSGEMTLGQSWRTVQGQTLTVAEGASFTVPTGMTFEVFANTHVVVEGTLVTDGTVYLQAGATVRAEAGLNIQTTVAGHVVDYNNGVYSVVEQTIFTQTIQLNAGWNWFSSYVETDLESLQAALGTNGVKIKDDNLYTDYYAEYDEWYGSLNSYSYNKMYMIKATEDIEISISGNLINTNDIEITLVPGWNWISYPNSESVDINIALQNLDSQEGDKIKSDSPYADYYEGYGWYGSLNTLEPGVGYMYYNSSNLTKTFTYSTSTRRSEAKANVTTEGNYWTPNAAQFANNMTMTAVLDVENINYEVAAFVNGECRGSARPIYVEALDAYMLFLTIHGEEVEEMTFKYYDIDTDIEYTLSDRINYSNNAILGSLKEPYMFTRGTTGIGEAELSQLNIYPNPTTTAAEINLNATFDKVEVFNALGVKVAEYSNVDSIDALETAGIYVIRATNNSVISHCRLVVK